MRFERDFTSRHRLKEWLESKSWEFEGTEEFYAWLEDFLEDGNILAVKGQYVDFQDCVDVFEADEV